MLTSLTGSRRRIPYAARRSGAAWGVGVAGVASGVQSSEQVMPAKDKNELAGCMTESDLARLFESAFVSWREADSAPPGPRKTPRVDECEGRELFVVSFTPQGEAEEVLNTRARVVDVSADGMGVELDQAVPTGATLRFAFESETGDRGYGEAVVARVVKQRDHYRVGLAFAEEAHALDVEHSGSIASAALQKWRDFLRQLGPMTIGLRRALRTLTHLGYTRRTLEKVSATHTAIFTVESRLLRFRASLVVDGVKVSQCAGTHHQPIHNLFSESAEPTVITLEGSGFSARAIAKTQCIVEANLSAKKATRRTPTKAHTVPKKKSASGKKVLIETEPAVRAVG